MAQFKVLVESFINNSIVQEGELVEYDGEASENLELVPAPEAPKSSKASS
jgi:hypothetical protein